MARARHRRVQKLRDVAQFARDVEGAGLSGIVITESRRTPYLTAELTGGRFRLGIGTQVRAHIERRYSAVFDQPGPRLREYVLALRAIFAAFQGSTRNYAHIFDQVGFEGTSARLNERMKAGDMTGMADLITDEMLEQFAITSTWDDLAGALTAKYQGTADRLVLYFAELLWRSDPNGLARLGEVAKALGG